MAGRRRRRPCLSRQRRRVRSRTDTATTRRPAPRRAGQGRGRWPPARRWLGLALPDVSDWDTPSACSVHGIVHETRCDAPGGARHPRARQDTGPGISRGHQRSQRLTGTPETGVAVLITQRSQVQSCPRYHCPRYQVVAGQEPDRRETVRLLTCTEGHSKGDVPHRSNRDSLPFHSRPLFLSRNESRECDTHGEQDRAGYAKRPLPSSASHLR